MMVVSMFDGYSSGLQALKDLGIHVSEYHAFEIDPYAIKVSEKNHPEIIRHGDVNDWHKADIDWMNVDLILAGSPCQGFSFAGKQLAFDDPRSALFFKWVELVNFMKLLKGDKCVFMLENVDMKQQHRDVITEKLRAEPVFINSKIHSPQSRPRWYWSNRKITEPGEVYSPLSGVLENDIPEKYFHTDKAIEYMNRTGSTGRVKWSYKFHSEERNGKSQCLTANYHKGVPNNVLVTESGCVRKFTPVECERLQGLPDNYTDRVSDTQRYKMLGNGWQLDTIKHIFKDILVKL